jgi:hypothetical protein
MTAGKKSKFQHPSSRETPSIKFQKAATLSGALKVGAWNFFGFWSLDFGI